MLAIPWLACRLAKVGMQARENDGRHRVQDRGAFDDGREQAAIYDLLANRGQRESNGDVEQFEPAEQGRPFVAVQGGADPDEPSRDQYVAQINGERRGDCGGDISEFGGPLKPDRADDHEKDYDDDHTFGVIDPINDGGIVKLHPSDMDDR